MSGGRLPDVLDRQAVEDRQRAVRALLRHGLLRPDGPDVKAFALVRKHSAALRDWFANEAGWTLQIDASLARLRKIPGSHDDSTRAAQVAQRAGQRTAGQRRLHLEGDSSRQVAVVCHLHGASVPREAHAPQT